MTKPGKVGRSTNSLPPSPQAGTSNKKNDDFNFSTQSNYKKFTDFLKESRLKQQKKTKTPRCNCWFCQILDSSTTSITNNDETDITTSATKRYEPYNIVSETGNSIFYDPLILSSIFNNEEGVDRPREGQIYIADDRFLDFVQDELAKKHFTGVNFYKDEF
jgi:hypothetical protein